VVVNDNTERLVDNTDVKSDGDDIKVWVKKSLENREQNQIKRQMKLSYIKDMVKSFKMGWIEDAKKLICEKLGPTNPRWYQLPKFLNDYDHLKVKSFNVYVLKLSRHIEEEYLDVVGDSDVDEKIDAIIDSFKIKKRKNILADEQSKKE